MLSTCAFPGFATRIRAHSRSWAHSHTESKLPHMHICTYAYEHIHTAAQAHMRLRLRLRLRLFALLRGPLRLRACMSASWMQRHLRTSARMRISAQARRLTRMYSAHKGRWYVCMLACLHVGMSACLRCVVNAHADACMHAYVYSYSIAYSPHTCMIDLVDM